MGMKKRKKWLTKMSAVLVAAVLCFQGLGMNTYGEEQASGQALPSGAEQTESGQPAADLAPVKAVYSTFMYARGWGAYIEDNVPNIAPPGSFITSIKATLSGQPEGMSGTVAYQVSLTGSGWLDWAENAAETGITYGEAYIDGLNMKLTGDLEGLYDIYYSVLQNGAWTDWVMNGQTAGMAGSGLSMNGIKISVVPKGSGIPPESIPNGIDPNRPMIALTFDDGPQAGVTDRILNSLSANGGRATFFMVGSRVAGHASQVQRMVAQGCEVANHTYDHKYLTKLGDAGIRSQVGSTNQVIANVCGVTPSLMRPCGGFYDSSSLATLSSMGIPAVMWSIDTKDWKTRNAQNTINVVLSQVKDGDIILMHDLYTATADAAEVLIPELTARGYQLVTVSELAAYRGGMAGGKVYSRFRP